MASCYAPRVTSPMKEVNVERSKLMTIDLSDGELRPVSNARLSITSAIETPWKSMLKLQEGEITTHELSGTATRGSLVGLDLPPSIGRESGVNRPGFPAQTPSLVTGEAFDEALDKETLLPKWRHTTGILLAELNPQLLARVASEMISPANITFMYPSRAKDPQIQHLMIALRAELEEGCPAGRSFGESLATTLAIHLIRKYSISAEKAGGHRGGLPIWRLRHVMDFIEEHLGEEIRLSQLADLAQMSLYHFGHLFKQSTGLPPHQFCLQRRIVRAKKLLADSRLSITEISQALGFASQAHFTTAFRKLVGITPHAYRNRNMR
jgi:AraC-like DNA-binding protein